jgi:hypothetical protein
MPKKRTWTIEQLKEAVKTSTSFRQVLAKLRLKEAGGNYFQLLKYIKEFNLDISHFKGQGWNKGLKGIGKPRVPLEKILVKNSTFQSYKLKNRLIKEGLKPPYCEICGWSQRTSDGRLPLELDHINGDVHNNCLENLRILCPNCHSLQPHYRGRNKGKYN